MGVNGKRTGTGWVERDCMVELVQCGEFGVVVLVLGGRGLTGRGWNGSLLEKKRERNSWPVWPARAVAVPPQGLGAAHSCGSAQRTERCARCTGDKCI